MEGTAECCRRVFDEGAARFPGVALAFDSFASVWGAMNVRREARVADAARGGRASGPGARPEDLFLAIACAEGAARAWENFDREYAPRLRGLLRKHRVADAEADDLVSDLSGYLCQPARDVKGATRIGAYDGSASLFSWLAVIVLRTVKHRRRRLAAAPESGTALADVSMRRGSPAHPAISQEMARRFQAAIASAWESLTPRERLAVLFKHRDGLRGCDIARLLGVGEPRVTRLLEAGLSRLRDAVRRQMPDTPPGTRTPDQAIWQAMTEVLARHLATLEPWPHQLGADE